MTAAGLPGRAQVVLVTGCRSGFGLLTAVELGRRGATVYAGLRDLSTADDLIQATAGLTVRPVQLDVTDGPQRRAAIQRIMTEQGHLDALVNNAGVALGGMQELLTEDELRRIFDVNFFGLWALTVAALPHLRASRGHICNVSSVAGRIALPGLGAYAASKFAVEGLTESLRLELAPHGVRVSLVEPGPYPTDIMGRNRRVAAALDEAALDDAGAAEQTPAIDAYQAQIERTLKLEQRVIQGLNSDPEQVSRKIAQLLELRAPRLRHPLGTSARVRLLFRWLLPFSVWQWLVLRVMRAG